MVNIVQFVAEVKCYVPDLQPLRDSKSKCAEGFCQILPFCRGAGAKNERASTRKALAQ